MFTERCASRHDHAKTPTTGSQIIKVVWWRVTTRVVRLFWAVIDISGIDFKAGSTPTYLSLILLDPYCLSSESSVKLHYALLK
jgi:hypothetical protein